MKLTTANENLWRPVSRGFAANNVDIDDVWLEVFCPELTGFVDGEINSEPVKLTTSGVDSDGSHYTCEILTTNSIKARWRADGSNRITAPNVRRGERVIVWQYSDADVYYWSVAGEDNNLRRLETVTNAYSNTKDETTTELNKDNTYYTTISTHQQKIELGTSKSNGEPFAHTVQLDTAQGLFTYKDDIGNIIQVNSKGNQVFIEVSSGAKVILDRDNISIEAPNTVTVKAGQLIHLEAPNVGIKGNVGVNGNLSLTGNLSTDGSVRNKGKDIGSTHRHGGVRGGPSQTGTPS